MILREVTDSSPANMHQQHRKPIQFTGIPANQPSNPSNVVRVKWRAELGKEGGRGVEAYQMK